MRINKYLAQCGVASRRKCDEIVQEGRVKVNGEVIRVVGTEIKDHTDIVVVDGKRVRTPMTKVYYKLHKPKGYITSANDENNRKTVIELMRGVKKRVFPIGRLDYDTEGLLIMTDDGELTNKITHPRHKVAKKYLAKIEGILSKEDIDALQKGVVIDGYSTEPAIINILHSDEKSQRVEITITEGKNHQVKKMFESVGKTVAFLKRVSIGEIVLGGLSRGEYRALNAKEMKYIQRLLSEE